MISNTGEESKPNANPPENEPAVKKEAPPQEINPPVPSEVAVEAPANAEQNVAPEPNSVPAQEIPETESQALEEDKSKPPATQRESPNESQRLMLEMGQMSSMSEGTSRTPQDELISFSDNEAYHEKVLTLLKINNNKALNSIYKRHVPTISKNALLMFDLTLASSVLLR